MDEVQKPGDYELLLLFIPVYILGTQTAFGNLFWPPFFVPYNSFV
jgi:hypothetical protein